MDNRILHSKPNSMNIHDTKKQHFSGISPIMYYLKLPPLIPLNPVISAALPPVTVSSLQSQVPVQDPLPQLTATLTAEESTEMLFSEPLKLMSEILTPSPGVPRVSG